MSTLTISPGADDRRDELTDIIEEAIEHHSDARMATTRVVNNLVSRGHITITTDLGMKVVREGVSALIHAKRLHWRNEAVRSSHKPVRTGTPKEMNQSAILGVAVRTLLSRYRLASHELRQMNKRGLLDAIEHLEAGKRGIEKKIMIYQSIADRLPSDDAIVGEHLMEDDLIEIFEQVEQLYAEDP